ncbi:uncharacterized protein MAM_00288 [Metarhizium album ARSEF 1941]|uniref:Uncharacterized protein n=1 Tax=Metarhizium album (strain ARSEF 1941) TaxID=1081103 RepID=A0A0B2WYG1_METAS|nr:uncharacterized protein MAM_00288 [Metarhizium album ARSEF 1941]KHO01287.1 hypothetical protein MAM_00288 [Metarhizium album ARSEF 1941]
MHVLGNIGHGFSQRRKTHKPKDLHIRKISLSGSSLSSGSSFSSSSSTATMRTCSSARTPTGLDPLSSHPTFSPPPRLHDRPLISPERCHHHQQVSTFLDDSTDDEVDGDYTVAKALHLSHPAEATTMLPPPHPFTLGGDDALTWTEPSNPLDYFTLQPASKRPPLPRSRWSESTIQTLDLDLDPELDQDLSSADDDVVTTPDSEVHVPLETEIPNFSHKRSVSTPKRPPMRSLDSLEDLIKRSGWKRRGVVFNESDAEEDI